MQKGNGIMAVSYKKLWHLLIDRNMKKKDLQEAANLTKHAMRKLSRDEAIIVFPLKYLREILIPICS